MHSLNKRWKELLFAANSFGPNLLFVLLGAYLTDALNPIGLTADIENWSLTGYCLVVPAMFGITWALAKVLYYKGFPRFCQEKPRDIKKRRRLF